MARVTLLGPEDMNEDNNTNREASEALFGLGKGINSGRLTAHIPLIARWLIPFIASMQRNGAGSQLPAKLKTMVDIKTSTVNDCAY